MLPILSVWILRNRKIDTEHGAEHTNAHMESESGNCLNVHKVGARLPIRAKRLGVAKCFGQIGNLAPTL